MRMKLPCNDLRVGIAIGDSQSLSARSRATIENARAMSHQSRDELRAFILDHTEGRAESSGPGDVSVLNSPRGSQESAGSQFDSFGAELVFRFGAT